MLEHFRSSGLLDEYYAYGFGTMQSSLWLSQAVKQITDRHPHLSLLEIGKLRLFISPDTFLVHHSFSFTIDSLMAGTRCWYWWCYQEYSSRDQS